MELVIARGCNSSAESSKAASIDAPSVRLASDRRTRSLAKSHSRTSRRREVRLWDFANERVLLSDASLTLGASIDAALLDSALELHPRAITNSIDLMIDLAVRGQGVTCQTRV